MKVTGQDVPIDLVERFNELISTQAIDGSGNGTMRTRRAAGRVIKSKSVRALYAEILNIAIFIADKLQMIKESQARKDFIFAETSRLLDGEFDVKYWDEADIESEEFYSSSPTNTLDSAPPAYGHRDINRRPSNVTYAAGTLTDGPSSSTGAVTGTQWLDGAWIWKKTVYNLTNEISGDDTITLIWYTAGTLTVNASTRGSRPMFSLVMRAHVCAEDSDRLEDNSAPIKPATSIYWRYQPVSDTAPFYQASTARHASIVLNDRCTTEPFDEQGKVIIKAAVRPMLGHGYNNNDSVTTSYDGTDKLMELKTPQHFVAWATTLTHDWSVPLKNVFKGAGKKVVTRSKSEGYYSSVGGFVHLRVYTDLFGGSVTIFERTRHAEDFPDISEDSGLVIDQGDQYAFISNAIKKYFQWTQYTWQRHWSGGSATTDRRKQVKRLYWDGREKMISDEPYYDNIGWENALNLVPVLFIVDREVPEYPGD